MSWTELVIDRETNELVAPCGCRWTNTLDGLLEARGHKHGTGIK